MLTLFHFLFHDGLESTPTSSESWYYLPHARKNKEKWWTLFWLTFDHIEFWKGWSLPKIYLSELVFSTEYFRQFLCLWRIENANVFWAEIKISFYIFIYISLNWKIQFLMISRVLFSTLFCSLKWNKNEYLLFEFML